MATIAPPTSPTTTIGCGSTPGQTEMIVRATCYLRLEEQSEAQLLLLSQRRETEQEKMFTALCGATDLAKLGDLWKAYDTAAVAIDAEVAVITKLQAVLKERTAALAKSSTWSLRAALEKRRGVLTEQYSREQKDALGVQARIAALEQRLKDLGTDGAQETAPAAADHRATKKT